MTTPSEREAALADEFRPVLAAHFQGPPPEGLVRDLAVAFSGFLARQIERHARSPRSQRGPGRQQQPETRRSA